MPAFTAINVEPEENVDEEIDNTREIQIDEALKRFQTALKLHAQGPKHYEDASLAYDSLFESEIFRYPESATDFERAERHSDSRHVGLDPPFSQPLDVVQGDIDGSGSSLPQTLYLAYKNHGHFALDKIKNSVKSQGGDAASTLEQKKLIAGAEKALYEFGAALDFDPSDAELWRRAARVGAYLSSARINRYCLEAAIELDDDPAVEEVEPPSLAEGFAGEQLKKQLDVLSDHLALSHPIMVPFLKRSIPGRLQKHLDPYPFLPNPTESLALPRLSAAHDGQTSERLLINVSVPSWAELGMAIVLSVAAGGISGAAVILDLPEIPDVDDDDDAQKLAKRPKSELPGQSKVAQRSSETKPAAQSKDEQGISPKDCSADNGNMADDMRGERSVSVPSRKRSQSAVGLLDGGDEEVVDQKRSKRIRRRETAGEVMDTNMQYATQLQPFQAADQNLFQMTRNVVENLGVTDRDTLDRLAEVLDSCACSTRTAKLERPAMTDLRDSLTKFDEDSTRVFLNKKEAPSVGLSSFLEHSKPGSQTRPEMPMFHETKGLKAFVQNVNDNWVGIQDIAFEWVNHACATYLTSKWPDAMKIAMVQVISHLDEDIWNRMQYELQYRASAENPDETFAMVDRMVQMLFELHLDVYDRITNPDSAVDLCIRMETKGRLGRWFTFASQMSRDRPDSAGNSLSIRFLWSAIFAVKSTEGVSRDHVLQCWKSLRDRLGEDQEEIDIRLPNNAIMPEVSAHAADREISKLTTMDFFHGLFQNDLSDPVSVIESLEPVLNPSSVHTVKRHSGSPEAMILDGESATPAIGHDELPISETANQGLRDLWKFLLGTSTELRLFLWNRLGEAYSAIDYTTKRFSCLLKSIEMVVADFEQESYLTIPAKARRPLFLNMLKFLDELLIKALSMALNDASAFDIVDDDHLRSSMSTLAKLCCILHVSCMYEDEVRVGMKQNLSNGPIFQAYLNRIREMQVRNWSLLYTMFKAGSAQDKSDLSTPESDFADYLAAVHQVLGLRKFCKSSNKVFLKMMRVELLKQDLNDNWEDYLGQVLYDLYGLKLGVGLGEVQDHGCPPEKLERRNTTALVERVSVLANRMPMKDLLKSDLKTTIEHMQQAIGQTKSSQQFIQNLRIFNQTLQRPIPPLRLYEALKGNISIDAVTVSSPDSALAKHRWFFLLGMIAFTKFKGVDLNRRQTPGATDDLRIGATFLRQQLQFTPDQWDAWFRLAECFDYELDESVLWTADKMNKERAELVKYQRSAIHCYTLALSQSRHTLPDALGETVDDIHDLYHKFGMRMYASSREPFAMEPFHHSEHKRFIILESGVESKDLYSQMEDYKVWKYAAGLFRRAMEVKPKQWQNPYMVAKCVWKMYQKPPTSLDHRDRRDRPTMQAVIDALEKAVEVVSALPKPRHGQDPVLEPHYKIVSIMHKLVMRGDMSPQEAAEVLKRQPYALQEGEYAEISEPEDWDPYVIKTLGHLREKDRSNWQHRIIMRHARILFDENSEEQGYVQAMAAFGVLRESMLTKTMVMNVWKCDAERPGRHHVYTEQYVRFVVKLLIVMKDRTNFEALLRRLRKKGADFYHFTDLWQTCCIAYLRLIRQAYHISPVLEDDFKAVSPEEFDIIASRISDWSSNSSSSHPVLSALQETIELKKLNAGLMKAGAIDDLISDCYTALYIELGKSLPGPAVSTLIAEREQARLRQDARQSDKVSESKPANQLSSLLNPQSHENSGAEGGAGDAAPASMEGAQRPRKTGIRRADILRKAEQAVLRAQEGPKPASAKSRGSVSSGKTPAADEEKEEGGANDDSRSDDGVPDDDIEMRDEEAEGDLSSASGSVHDSADDESDLSDAPPEDVLDEDEAQQLMFPNLTRRSVDSARNEESNDDDSSTAESEVEDADEDEEDEEEGDDDEEEEMGEVGDAGEAEE